MGWLEVLLLILLGFHCPWGCLKWYLQQCDPEGAGGGGQLGRLFCPSAAWPGT